MHPYRPRSINFHGVRSHDGWHVKLYTISFDGSAVDWSRFDPAVSTALAALPSPAITTGRPGLAFVIAHHGRTVDYLVLGWWDNENELPLRVFVREPDAADWRPAQGSESVCVWDLEVIWAERIAYVDTVLGPTASAEEYLHRHGGWPDDKIG
ncbi:MAG: isochorismatase [Gemmatimonadota bacterium]|nr:isochorismatase [Gemmatimonadota bacterium]